MRSHKQARYIDAIELLPFEISVVKLEELQEGKIVSRRKVITSDRPTVIDSADDIGLDREDANALLSSLQQILVSSQFDHDARHRGNHASFLIDAAR